MNSSFDGMIRFFFYAGSAAIVCFFIFSLHVFGHTALPANTSSSDVTVGLAGKSFRCMASRMAQEQEQGLSGRASLSPYDCMLFFMPYTDRHAFWMKDMKFPIDIIWIRDGKVVDISSNVPVPTSPEAVLPTYRPKEAADQVMEVVAGFVQEHGIVIGQAIQVSE